MGGEGGGGGMGVIVCVRRVQRTVCGGCDQRDEAGLDRKEKRDREELDEAPTFLLASLATSLHSRLHSDTTYQPIRHTREVRQGTAQAACVGMRRQPVEEPGKGCLGSRMCAPCPSLADCQGCAASSWRLEVHTPRAPASLAGRSQPALRRLSASYEQEVE